MTTTLQKQLNKLAKPQETSIFNYEKQRVSFLFDPSEASTIEPEVIYGIGLNGIEELCSLDGSFIQFYSKLFDEKIINFDRRLKTKEENEELNSTIKKFLLRISPYFLLKCAHKVIEWLIFRLYIHIFNKEEFIAMVLPYHETKSFVRAIQVLNLGDESSHWNWLVKVQQSGYPLSRNAVVSRLGKDSRFLGFVCKLASEYSKILPTTGNFYSFYSARILSTLFQMKERRAETILVQILPFLVEGVNCESSELYRNASYIILGHLFTSTSYLSSKDCFNFALLFVSKKFDDKGPSEVELILKLLSFIFQKHETIEFNEKIFSFIINIVQIDKKLILIYKSGLKSLCFLFLKELTNYVFIESGGNYEFQILLTFLNESFLSEQHQFEFFDYFLRIYENNSQTSLENGSHLLRIFEITYKNNFSKIVNMLHKDESVKWKLAQLSNECSTENRFLFDSETTLFLAINDANPSIRLGAISELKKNIDQNNVDHKFVRDLLISTFDFETDDINYFVELFSSIKVSDYLTPEELFQGFGKVLNQIGRSNLNTRHKLVVLFHSLFKSYDIFVSSLTSFRLLLFSELLVFNEEDNSFLISSLKDSKFLGFKSSSFKTQEKLNCVIIRNMYNLFSNGYKMNIDKIKFIFMDDSQKSSFIALLCLGFISLDNELDYQRLSFLISTFITLFNRLKIYSYKKTKLDNYNRLFDDSKNSFRFISKSILEESSLFAPNCIASVLNRICMNVHKIFKKLKFNEFWSNFQVDVKHEQLFKDLISLLNLFSSARSKNLFKVFVKEIYITAFGSEYTQILNFINLAFICYDNRLFEINFDLNFLTKFSKHLLTFINFQSLMDSESNTKFMLLLVSCLSSSDRNLRESVFEIIGFIINDSNSEWNASLECLIDRVCSMKDLIIISRDNFVDCLYELFSKPHLQIGGKRQKLDISDHSVNFDRLFVNYLNHSNLYLFDAIISSLPSNAVETIKFIFNKFRKNFKNFEKSDFIKNIVHVFNNLVVKLTGSTIISLAGEILKLLELEQLPTSIFLSLIEKLNSNVDFIREFYSNDDKSKLKFVEKLFSLRFESNVMADSQLATCFYGFFNSFDLPVSFFMNHMDLEQNVPEINFSTRGDKNKRQTSQDSICIENSSETFNIAIELLANSNSITDAGKTPIVSVLFKILNLLNENDDYNIQLILSCLIKMLESENISKNLSESDMNVEAVLRVMALSKYVMVHQKGVAVIISITRCFPNLMLSNLISVFTFVSRLLYQVNDYMSDLIENLIASVVPLLLNNEYDEIQIVKSVADILRIFLDTVPDIPSQHLRPILSTLVRVMGERRFLCFIYLLVCELNVTSSFESLNDIFTENIIMILSLQFSANVALDSIGKLIEFYQILPLKWKKHISLINTKSIKHDKFEQFTAWFENLKIIKTNSQNYHKFLDGIPSFVSSILKTKVFYQMATKLSSESEEGMESIKSVQKIIELCISNIDDSSVNGNKFIDILTLTVKIMPENFVIKVLSHLFENSNVDVKCRSIELFYDFLQRESRIFLEQRDDLLLLIGTLCEAFYLNNAIIGDVKTQKTIFLILKLLVKGLSPISENQLEKLLLITKRAIEEPNSSEECVASALLCMAEIISAGEYSMIPFVNSTCESYLNFVAQRNHILFIDKSVFISAFIFLERIVRILPQFLSPFILNFIELAVDWQYNSRFDFEWISLTTRLEDLKLKISQNTKTSLIFKAVENSTASLDQVEIKTAQNRIVGSFEILQLHFKLFDQSRAETVLDELLATLLSIWTVFVNYECENKNGVSCGNRTCLNSSIDSTILIVMKLSESTFRPFFMEVWSWTLNDEEVTEENFIRLFYFYTFCRRLSTELKTIFLIFVNIFHDNMINLLLFGLEKIDKFSDIHKDLFSAIFDTLFFCFVNSNPDLLIRSFNLTQIGRIMVDYIFKSDEIGETVITQNLIPAISQYFSAYDDENEWLSISQYLLTKVKENFSEKNIFLTFDVLESICRKLSVRFTTILHPIVPFVAERMEDRNEIISSKCNNFALLVEDICGESLSSYF